MKRLILFIIAGILAGIGVSLVYDFYLSPDRLYFLKAAELSDEWAEKLRAESDEPCYVLAGGSEVRMCIDPDIIHKEHGVRLITAGGMAGFGLTCNVTHAFKYLKPGDTLIVSCRHFVFPENDITTGGLKFCWATMGTDMFRHGLIPFNLTHLSHIFRPNSDELSMYLTKRILKPDELFKYNSKTVQHPSGWCENFHIEKNLLMQYAVYTTNISRSFIIQQRAAQFFDKLNQICHKKNIRLLVFQNIEYSHSTTDRDIVTSALALTREGISVIKLDSLSNERDIQYMADRPNHLNSKGAQKYSNELGVALKNNRVWTEKELLQTLYKLGFDAQGNMRYSHKMWRYLYIENEWR